MKQRSWVNQTTFLTRSWRTGKCKFVVLVKTLKTENTRIYSANSRQKQTIFYHKWGYQNHTRSLVKTVNVFYEGT